MHHDPPWPRDFALSTPASNNTLVPVHACTNASIHLGTTRQPASPSQPSPSQSDTGYLGKRNATATRGQTATALTSRQQRKRDKTTAGQVAAQDRHTRKRPTLAAKHPQCRDKGKRKKGKRWKRRPLPPNHHLPSLSIPHRWAKG